MKLITSALSELIEDTKENHLIYRPLFFRLQNEEDSSAVGDLLQQPGIKVSDELHGQLRELVKAKHPTEKISSDDLDDRAFDYRAEFLQMNMECGYIIRG